ncbi:hypothetical protein B0H11DRAFT_2291740 [Mycena galericulata]|nr:hypothetical protein B0H11DRAFT_2291740 [Mycena galericulata]
MLATITSDVEKTVIRVSLSEKNLSAKVARLYTVNCIFPYAIVAVALMFVRIQSPLKYLY